MQFPKEETGSLFAPQPSQRPFDGFGSGSLAEEMQPRAFYYTNRAFLISRRCSSSKVFTAQPHLHGKT